MFGINDNQDENSQTEPKSDAPEVNEAGHDTAPDEPAGSPAVFDSPSSNGGASGASGSHSLMSIKEQALTNLSPLVNHLDQTPDERFKTLMMLIQASDNSNLIKEAYEAANKIQDEKVRAQALLDVINEINYFTQKEK